MKKEFDSHRKKGLKSKEIPEEFTLFQDYHRFKNWRNKGIEIQHKSGIVIYGKIDDLLIDSYGNFIPFDFKTTLSKEFQIYESYKRQLGIYGYLFQQSGERVLNVGALYVVKLSVDLENGFKEERNFYKVPDLNFEIYSDIIEKLVYVIKRDRPPEPKETCQFCMWFEKRKVLISVFSN